MDKRIAKYLGLFLWVCYLAPGPAFADWINLFGAENAPNIAEFRINADHVRIDLEVYVKDIVIFDALIPDEYFKDMDIQAAASRTAETVFHNGPADRR